MPVGQIVRSAAAVGRNRPNSNPIRVHATTEELKFGTGAAGDQTEKTVVDTTTAQTLANKTLTSPVINGAITSGIAFATTQFDAVTGTTGTTLTNIVGMVLTVVPGTYAFVLRLPGIATTNCGIKIGFKYTTAVLSALEAMARVFTASAVAVAHTTTATDQASLAASTTAALFTEITGRLIVTTGGTIQVQAAQNALHADTTSVYIGASFQLTRTA